MIDTLKRGLYEKGLVFYMSCVSMSFVSDLASGGRVLYARDTFDLRDRRTDGQVRDGMESLFVWSLTPPC